MSTPSERAIAMRAERQAELEREEALRTKCKLDCPELKMQYHGRGLNQYEYVEMQDQLATMAAQLKQAGQPERFQSALEAKDCLDKYFFECQPEKVQILRRELRETHQAKRLGMRVKGEKL